MERFSQVGIAIGALGIMIALMGLFPGVTGVEPTIGIGIVQVFMLLVGYGLLIIGALMYVKFTFYLGVRTTLTQQIGTRLALTGLLFAALSGLADILGFGTHLRTADSDIFLGELQALGILLNFGISSFGIIIYAVSGTPHDPNMTQEMHVVQLPDAITPDDDAIDDAIDAASEPAPDPQATIETDRV